MADYPYSVDKLRSVARQMRRIRLRDLPILVYVLRLLVRYLVHAKSLALPRLVERFGAVEKPLQLPEGEGRRAVRLARTVVRGVYGRDCCFPRSLILFNLYRRLGGSPVLYVGVTRREGSLKSHAWIDAGSSGEDVPNGSSSDEPYRVVFQYPR